MKKQVLYILATIVPILAMGQITEVANINPAGDSNPAEFYVDSSNRLFFQLIMEPTEKNYTFIMALQLL